MKDMVINEPTEKINDGKKRIAIAMQGGGAHGAFTWGVLDRLLEEKDNLNTLYDIYLKI